MATTKSKQNKLNLQMREILGNAYGFVRGREYTKSVANITYEQLLDAAIDRIEGTKGRTEVRGTILDRIKKIKEEVSQAVDTVKKRPPHEWVIESEDRSSKEDLANTEE
jgi:hypothetical protein